MNPINLFKIKDSTNGWWNLSLIVFVLFRISTCPTPPPMVKHFDYTVSQTEALTKCQSALKKLGYTIEVYDLIDKYLITEMRTIKLGFRQIKYRIFLKIEDRIRVYIYAETKVFKRFSERGIKVGELTEYQTSHNLSYKFQKAIFDPIIQAFEKQGFHYWDEYEGNKIDDEQIKGIVMSKRENIIANKKKLESFEKQEKIRRSEAYMRTKDQDRLESMEEAEHFVEVFSKFEKLKPSSKEMSHWSLIQINKIVLSRDEYFKNFIATILNKYPQYSGTCNLYWTITLDGVVKDVLIHLETTPFTPEDELRRGIFDEVRSWYFPPPINGTSLIRLSRKMKYFGQYHNIKFKFYRPQIVEIIEPLPIDSLDTGLFFEE